MRHKVLFTAKRCDGDANSYYDADTVEIIYCYELMDDFISLYVNDVPDGITAPGQIRRNGRIE
ncbi:hypothetical protein PSQ19_05695 [Devosia algicola]|uniref:Uncharacterized protein n=1 Tax=Devosia algicola TaxID=3026418 RepID=A0ABY7YQH7_9HYPH|nr:hypothetical protein [Devosia algicola]WDR03578.1 hypothetical protein PSQ19_05695 [Devosia algicola]